jgi:hypothetical protein
MSSRDLNILVVLSTAQVPVGGSDKPSPATGVESNIILSLDNSTQYNIRSIAVVHTLRSCVIALSNCVTRVLRVKLQGSMATKLLLSLCWLVLGQLSRQG